MKSSNVCVVLSTYNGEKYLKEQIDSILSQKEIDLCLYVRDDGSTDKTIDILKSYEDNILKVIRGNNIGAKHSFIEAIISSPDADYYALSDQDDVWENNKLQCAISLIKKEEIDNKYVLYCGRTHLVNSDLSYIRDGREFNLEEERDFLCGEVGFANGCTMVFNKALKQMIELYHPNVFPMHDAWITLVCLALGGKVIHDNEPHMYYRQHGDNCVGGEKRFFASAFRRLKFNIKMGRNYQTKMYKEILHAYEKEMPVKNTERCKMVCNYNSSLRNKARLLTDKQFWAGRLVWKIETLFFVVLGLY